MCDHKGGRPSPRRASVSCGSGDRKNDIMHAIADRMSDADIKAVSDYAAGLR